MIKPSTDHLGREYESISAMCRAWGVNQATFASRLERGLSIEEALDPELHYVGVKAKLCRDHLGREYPSKAAMCKAWGVHRNTFDGRMAQGWTVEQALTAPKTAAGFEASACTDHTGREFASIGEMCRAWGISKSTLRYRLDAGWGLEKALTSNPRAIADHTGRVFPSAAEMCREWGVSQSAFKNRCAAGWSLEKTLTTPVADRACSDHLGREFSSLSEMARVWGLSNDTLAARIKSGMPLEEALTKPVNKNMGHGKGVSRRPVPCTDHLGREYPSKAAMCRAWGINAPVFDSRIKRGMSVEEALTSADARGGKNATPCADHLGQEYRSVSAMCKAWGVIPQTYSQRVKLGWSVEEALTGVRDEGAPREEKVKGVPREEKGSEGQEQPKEEKTVEDTPREEKPAQGKGVEGQGQEERPRRKPGELKSAPNKPRPQKLSGFGDTPGADARTCGGSAADRGINGPKKSGPDKKK